MEIPVRIRNERIIGAGLRWLYLLAGCLLLAGCSPSRFAYNQAPEVAYWWADNYVDFTDEQATQVRADIARWFDWHRHTQLPRYAQAMAEAQQEVMTQVGAKQACAWWGRALRWRDDAFEQALPALADSALRLQPEQIDNIERRYGKNNRDFRREYLQPSAEARLEHNVKRTVERAEMLYGKLDGAQRMWVQDEVAASPFDPELWFAERMRRQQDLLQVLRQLQRTQPGKEQAQAAIRGYYQRIGESPDERWRAHNPQLVAYNCEFAAQLHNRTTPAQRHQAQDKIRRWQSDMLALAVEGR